MVWLWLYIEMVGYAIMLYLLPHSLNLLFNIFIYVGLNVKKKDLHTFSFILCLLCFLQCIFEFVAADGYWLVG